MIQVAKKSLKKHSNKWMNPENEELKNLEDSNTESTKRHEIKFDLNTPRAQGGKGLLSCSIPVQELKNPSLKSFPREEREKEQRGEREAHGRGCRGSVRLEQEKSKSSPRQAGGERVFVMPMQASKIPLDLN